MFNSLLYFILFLSVRLHVRDASQRIELCRDRVADLIYLISPIEMHRAIERVVTNNPAFCSMNHKIQRAHFATYTVNVFAYVVRLFVVDVCSEQRPARPTRRVAYLSIGRPVHVCHEVA